MPQPTPQAHQGRRDRPEPSPSRVDWSRVKFTAPLDPELFNSIAQQAAQAVSANDRSNKPTQLRRFYDELTLWESRVARQPERFQDYLPFIRMINAKVAYAEGRKLVDSTFVGLMHHTLNQVKDDPQTLMTCKLFWEAFMGFYKKVRPSD
jgi:CRISPR-associated protein Csm2